MPLSPWVLVMRCGFLTTHGHHHLGPVLFPTVSTVSVYMPPTLYFQLNGTQTCQSRGFCLAAAFNNVWTSSLTNPSVSPGFGRADHIVSWSTEPCLKAVGAAQSSWLARGLLSGGEDTLLLQRCSIITLSSEHASDSKKTRPVKGIS